MLDGTDDARDSGMSVEAGTVALLSKAEIDQQIATAHQYPRSIQRFRNETLQMVTLNQQIAGECVYSLPRDGKVIEGPSARFAEVIASAWGNSRAGARIVNEGPEFITAQGVFHDLERNVAITYEVQRRIVDKYGKRFKADMIGVTANAACSIGLRNAILKGVPKAFWSDMYQAARKVIMGDVRTLTNRRAECFAEFQRFGVTEQQIFAVLGVAGAPDVSIEHMVTLAGMLTAIRDGDTTIEQLFGESRPTVRMPQARTENEGRAPATEEPKGAAAPAASSEGQPQSGPIAAGTSAAAASTQEPPPPEADLRAAAQAAIEEVVTPAMAKMIRVNLKDGRTESQVAEKFGVGSIDLIPKAMVNSVLKYARSGE